MLVFLNVLRVAWKPLIICLILASTYFAFNRLQAQRDNAIRDLNDYKQQQLVLAKQQKAEIEIKLDLARKHLSEVEVKYNNIINDLYDEKQKVADDLGKQYEKRMANYTLTHSMLPQSGSTESTAETPSDTEGLATGEPKPDTTCAGLQAEYQTLEDAAVLTTIYFNLCRETLDADSLILERE